MPELPEVETVVQGLRNATIEGQTITDVVVNWERSVGGNAVSFTNQVRGRTIIAIRRRAKYIVIELDNDQMLLIHLRMTGKLRRECISAKLQPHDRVVLQLSNGEQLCFNDTRKFGRMTLAPLHGTTPLDKLGPEPLENTFTPKLLQQQLAGRRRAIKPLLLDQSCIAGLGNIYVDEALWQAQIHPERSATTLTPNEIAKLHKAIRSVLLLGIKQGGTSLGDGLDNFYSVAGRRGRNADGLKVFRRDGEPCPRCSTIIARSVVAQRGTHFCPVCQPTL